MNTKEFKENFRSTLETMYEVMEKKNSDYAKWWAFDNFELVEKLWVTSVEKGIFIRMLDKVGRISSLLEQENKVKDESIIDSISDLANYSVLLKVYLEDKKKNWKIDEVNYLEKYLTYKYKNSN